MLQSVLPLKLVLPVRVLQKPPGHVSNQQTDDSAPSRGWKRLAFASVEYRPNSIAVTSDYLAGLPVRELVYEVLPSEEAVGRAMLEEIVNLRRRKTARS